MRFIIIISLSFFLVSQAIAQTILHKVQLPCESDNMGDQFILRNNRVNTVTIMVEGELCEDLQFFSDSSRYIKRGCDLIIEPQLDSQGFSDFNNLWFGQFPIYVLHSGIMDTLRFTVLPPVDLYLMWNYDKNNIPQGIKITDSCGFNIRMDSSTILFHYKDSMVSITFNGMIFPEFFNQEMNKPELKYIEYEYAYYRRDGVAVKEKKTFTHWLLHNN